MRMIDILRDFLCPHHYILLSYAKQLSFALPSGKYSDYSTYDISAVLKCDRCGLVKTAFIRKATSYQAKDIPDLAKVCEQYDCWEVL